MDEKIRVLVVDDQRVVREGIAALIAEETEIEVVGQAGDGIEAVDLADKLRPDVILLDLIMPRMDGIQAIREITRFDWEPRILVLTSFAEDDQVFSAIQAGALGYLIKDTSPAELLEAIRKVDQGESFLPPTIARKLMHEISQPRGLPPTEAPLTEREAIVLSLIAEGLSNREIGERLVISERTVHGHVGNILKKLHLANRTQAALYALREGYGGAQKK
jgi:NarL family two-component system response regulator LiaR